MKTVFSLSVLVTLALAAGCGENKQGAGGSGFIEATTVVVSAETGGRLEALYYDEGDAIARGAVIGVIDSTTVKLQLGQATAQRRAAASAVEVARINIEQAAEDAALAKKEFDRVAALLKKGSANQRQYDQAENAARQSELARQLARATHRARQAELARIDAEIDLLHRRLADCYPTSPVTGLTTTKFTEAGELLAPGKPIIEVAKTDTVWVKIYLPAGRLTAVGLGQTVAVDPEDGRTSPLDGRVVWIADEAEFTPKNVQTEEARADLVYAVKVNVANPGGALKIGMPVMVRIAP
jgi:HlyD family secretion protein